MHACGREMGQMGGRRPGLQLQEGTGFPRDLGHPRTTCTKPESFTENAGPARGCILIVSLLVYFIKSRNNTKCPLALTCSIHFTTY